MNSVNLIGRLTGEPRVITTKTGKKVAHFNLALNGQRGNTTFVQITAWDQCCTTVEKYLHKGYQVGIAGRLATSNSGELEVVANAISLIESVATKATKQPEQHSDTVSAEDLLNELEEDFPM